MILEILSTLHISRAAKSGSEMYLGILKMARVKTTGHQSHEWNNESSGGIVIWLKGTAKRVSTQKEELSVGSNLGRMLGVR